MQQIYEPATINAKQIDNFQSQYKINGYLLDSLLDYNTNFCRALKPSDIRVLLAIFKLLNKHSDSLEYTIDAVCLQCKPSDLYEAFELVKVQKKRQKDFKSNDIKYCIKSFHLFSEYKHHTKPDKKESLILPIEKEGKAFKLLINNYLLKGFNAATPRYTTLPNNLYSSLAEHTERMTTSYLLFALYCIRAKSMSKSNHFVLNEDSLHLLLQLHNDIKICQYSRVNTIKENAIQIAIKAGLIADKEVVTGKKGQLVYKFHLKGML